MTGPAPNNPNATRTHCPHGHEYTPANTKLLPYTRRDGATAFKRQCRKCKHGTSKTKRTDGRVTP
jgi:hypothetical protein